MFRKEEEWRFLPLAVDCACWPMIIHVREAAASNADKQILRCNGLTATEVCQMSPGDPQPNTRTPDDQD